MVKAIHDKVEGRARFKVPGLQRSEPLKRFLESQLSEKSGILSVSASVTTGNLLVSFNSYNNSKSVGRLISDVLQTAQLGIKTSPPKDSKQPPTEKRTRVDRIPTKETGPPAPVDLFPSRVASPPSWHLKTSDSLVDEFQTSPKRGLAVKVVDARLKELGPNRLADVKKRSGWDIFTEQLNSLPTYLLGAAAVVSGLTGGVLEAVVIMGVVVANATIGYYTENEAEQTINSLKELVQPHAEVVREGKIATMPAEQVVPGDILVLKPGAYVAADCRIIKAIHLSIDESMLTGESLPVTKTARTLTRENLAIGDRTNMGFMGTLVTGGQGLGLVVATGIGTELGQLQLLLQETVQPKTPIEKQLGQMGDQLVLLCGGICGVVFAMGFVRGYALMQMLKSSISLAAAAVRRDFRLPPPSILPWASPI